MMGFVKGKSFLEIHAGNRIPQQILGTPAYITLYQIGFQRGKAVGQAGMVNRGGNGGITIGQGSIKIKEDQGRQ